MKLVLLTIVGFLIGIFLNAQELRNYSAQSVENIGLTVDGSLDEQAWQNVVWQGDFVQFEPEEGAAPTRQTEFAILYDAANLYIAIRSFDDPDSISMRKSRRDDREGDWVGIGFDSYFDKRTYFGFFVSAAGVRTDLLGSEDGNNEDSNWDALWIAKTRVHQQGWNTEIKIPLTQLRFKESEEQLWGLQVVRYIFRNDELSAWQPMKREIAGLTSQFGTMNGIRNIRPRNVFTLTPYLLASTERFEKVPENPFLSSGRKNNFDAGLDAKIGLTNNLTMDLTVNPDFGQVEADPSEVNLTTYETFFREKRPFFIEGNNILSYSLSFGDGNLASNNLFYSRRIGRRPHCEPELEDDEYADHPEFTRILGAAKISGKTPDGWSIGILESVTSKEYAEIDGINGKKNQAVEPLTNYFVSRIQKDFNEGNTYMGGIFTAVNRSIDEQGLEFLHKSAYTGGLDFVHKWNDKDWMVDAGMYFSRVAGSEEAILNTQTMYSRTYQRPDAEYVTLDSTRTSLSGHGGKLAFGKVGGRFRFVGFFNWKSPGLEINDVGYTQEVDEIMQIFWAGYRWFEPFSIFRSANANLNQWTVYDFGGELVNYGGNINGHAQFKNFWNAFANLSWDSQALSHSVLRGGPSMKKPGSLSFYAGFESNPQKKITYGFESGLNIGVPSEYSSGRSFEIELGYRPLEALQIEISPEFSIGKTKLQYVTQEDFGGDTRYILSTIDRKTLGMSMRINYSITPDLTIQFWGQPFVASGDYSEFKYITEARATNIVDRYQLYSSKQLSYNSATEMYGIDDNGDGTIDYGFDKPDFNVREFLSNLVLRWEYRPGSLVYLVWSQNRNAYENMGKFDLGHDIRHLIDASSDDVFLVKFSYRFGR